MCICVHVCIYRHHDDRLCYRRQMLLSPSSSKWVSHSHASKRITPKWHRQFLTLKHRMHTKHRIATGNTILVMRKCSFFSYSFSRSKVVAYIANENFGNHHQMQMVRRRGGGATWKTAIEIYSYIKRKIYTHLDWASKCFIANVWLSHMKRGEFIVRGDTPAILAEKIFR